MRKKTAKESLKIQQKTIERKATSPDTTIFGAIYPLFKMVQNKGVKKQQILNEKLFEDYF